MTENPIGEGGCLKKLKVNENQSIVTARHVLPAVIDRKLCPPVKVKTPPSGPRISLPKTEHLKGVEISTQTDLPGGGLICKCICTCNAQASRESEREKLKEQVTQKIQQKPLVIVRKRRRRKRDRDLKQLTSTEGDLRTTYLLPPGLSATRIQTPLNWKWHDLKNFSSGTFHSEGNHKATQTWVDLKNQTCNNKLKKFPATPVHPPVPAALPPPVQGAIPLPLLLNPIFPLLNQAYRLY